MPDEKPNPTESRQLDFLLADLNALKTEILQRNASQRVALTLYLAGVVAVSGSLLVDNKNLSVAIPGLWLGGLLTLLFWCREALEITRLGRIRKRIAAKARAILGALEAEDLVPSAEAPTVNKDMDRTTHCYHLAFMWLALFVTPLLLTLHTLLQRFDQLTRLCAFSTLTPALVALVCMIASLWLLARLAHRKEGD